MTSPSDNLLERVARAMAAAEGYVGDRDPWKNPVGGSVPQNLNRHTWLGRARAAIEASNDLVGEMESLIRGLLSFADPISEKDDQTVLAARKLMARMRDARNA